ncbi:5867_t:CDS:10, partial [Racocetra persica]
ILSQDLSKKMCSRCYVKKKVADFCRSSSSGTQDGMRMLHAIYDTILQDIVNDNDQDNDISKIELDQDLLTIVSFDQLNIIDKHDLKIIENKFRQLANTIIVPLESGSCYYWEIHKIYLNSKNKIPDNQPPKRISEARTPINRYNCEENIRLTIFPEKQYVLVQRHHLLMHKKPTYRQVEFPIKAREWIQDNSLFNIKSAEMYHRLCIGVVLVPSLPRSVNGYCPLADPEFWGSASKVSPYKMNIKEYALYVMETKNFPLLVPSDVDELSYCGFITVKGQELAFQIKLENNSACLKNAKLYGSPELKRLIFGHEKALQQELLMTKEKTDPSPGENYYSTLINELNSIGWDKLEAFNPSLRNLSLKLNDSSGRQHSIFVSLPFSYPKATLIVHAELPTPLPVTLNHMTSLKDVVSFCSKELEKFQDVWSMLDDIDKHTWILEPCKPKRSDLMRRIALGNHCSLQIELDVSCPKGECQYRLFGTESLISPLRDKIIKNWNNWLSSDLTIRQNFENILEITFPSAQTISTLDINIECGICYSYRHEGSLPDQSCNNAKCGQPFHRSCLYEWLRSIPSTKQSFNTFFGNCPYCNDAITTTICDQ